MTIGLARETLIHLTNPSDITYLCLLGPLLINRPKPFFALAGGAPKPDD